MEQIVYPNLISTGAHEFKNHSLLAAKLRIVKQLSSTASQTAENFCHRRRIHYFDIAIDFEYSDESMLAPIMEHFSLRPLSEQQSNCQLTIKLISPNAITLFPHDWEEEPSSDLWCGQYEQGVFAIQRDFVALLQNASATDKKILALWEPHQPDGAMNFLRWALPWAMLSRSMALLHSSAFLDSHNRAHVVIGVSGAGKTTLASKSLPRPVIGDDMNVISFGSNGCEIGVSNLGGIFPTLPFDQKLYPIAAFYLPQKIKNGLQLTAIRQGQLMRTVLASIANCSWPYLPQDLIQKIMGELAHSLLSTPAYELAFSLDQEVWNDIIT